MDKYKELSEITKLIAQLKDKETSLREDILVEVTKEGGTIKNKFGLFIEVKNKIWVYPKKVLDIEAKGKKLMAKVQQEIKEAKIKSQNSGRANFEEQSSLRFTPVK